MTLVFLIHILGLFRDMEDRLELYSSTNFQDGVCRASPVCARLLQLWRGFQQKKRLVKEWASSLILDKVLS